MARALYSGRIVASGCSVRATGPRKRKRCVSSGFRTAWRWRPRPPPQLRPPTEQESVHSVRDSPGVGRPAAGAVYAPGRVMGDASPGPAIVCGIGYVGYRIVEGLRRAGETVVAVDRDPEGEFAEAVRGLGAVVTGDSRLPETLHKAGVPRARAVVAVAPDDAGNPGGGLAARPPRADVRAGGRLLDSRLSREGPGAVRVRGAPCASALSGPP